jgi:predicted PurR-regulated permease PerM
MSAPSYIRYWAAGLAAFLVFLWLLADMLFPFVAGIVLAYLLDPIADRLETWKLPRSAAAGVITLLMVVLVVVAALLVVPLLQAQLVDFAGRVPGYLEALREQAAALLVLAQERLSDAEMASLREKLKGFAGPDAIGWVGKLLARVWGGGVALLNLLSLLVITPIVLFYLLRDWDRVVEIVDGWLPRRHVETIREQVGAIDDVLSGFIRGQVSVCLILGMFYGLGLTLIGLDFGLIIGFGTGLISFVPYFGMLIGFVVGVGVALAQFGDLQPVAMVAGLFVVGQFLEGNFITPKLVGGRVGLPPVWIIFALLASGALFGFTGILLAVPVAAVIGVLSRFGIRKYKESGAYSDDPSSVGPPAAGDDPNP